MNKKDIQLEFLRNCKYDTVGFFSLNGWQGHAKVVKLYDGDTMTVVIFVNDKPFKFRIRLAGIDTAEKTSKNSKEVEWAEQAIQWAADFIDNDLIYIKCHRMDKYGRVLATVFKDERCAYSLNNVLLGAGLAYEYNGGSRKPFEEWALGKDGGVPTLKEFINDSEVLEKL